MAASAQSPRRQMPDLARVVAFMVAICVVVGICAAVSLPPASKAGEASAGTGPGGLKVQDLNRIPHLIIHDCPGSCWQPTVPLRIRLDPIDASRLTRNGAAVRPNPTGVVVLQLLVGVDGRVIEAGVVDSSGDPRLDDAAREHVLRNWRFRPATQDGAPAMAAGRVPIVFTLDGR